MNLLDINNFSCPQCHTQQELWYVFNSYNINIREESNYINITNVNGLDLININNYSILYNIDHSYYFPLKLTCIEKQCDHCNLNVAFGIMNNKAIYFLNLKYKTFSLNWRNENADLYSKEHDVSINLNQPNLSIDFICSMVSKINQLVDLS